ncbi:unnamed protein product [Zymoseptoria tritici ST99CH_3D7]|uniref:Uncharacterized protein n=1 Tax=Zymoseptoria tritici (strain ST99CH_3D7) TaxID=1276538 RepID=A0A1X7S118_ZYMT9|nr:unnamed protein product [Zymoseptoria tritici ST99CH_3D7]
MSSNNNITTLQITTPSHCITPTHQQRPYEYLHRHTITSSPSNRSILRQILHQIPPPPPVSPLLSTALHQTQTNHPTNHITMSSKDILGNERFGRRDNREQYVLDAAWALYMMSRRDVGEAKEQMQDRERDKREKRAKQREGEEEARKGEEKGR